MQFRKFLLLPTFIGCFSILSLHLSGQEVRVNDRGEKIIVYQDGSWQYFSDLVQGNHAIYRSTPETASDFPVFGGDVAPMEGPQIDLTEEYVQKIFIRKAQLTRSAAAIAQTRAIKARLQREDIEREYRRLENQTDPEDDLFRLTQNRLKAAQKMESKTDWEAQQARLEAHRAEQKAKSGNYIELLKQEQNKPLPPQAREREVELLAGNFYENLVYLDQSPEILADKKNKRNTDLRACRFAFEGKDQYSGQARRDVQQELLFSHTNEDLRMYLKDKEYLQCNAFLSSIAGGFRFLSLQFTFAYPNAQEAYGFIEKGSFLTIKLIDGQFVNLRAGKTDRGAYDAETGLVTYQVHYAIGVNLMNDLQKSEADTIKIFWSSGYEEYKVYNVDFFIHQMYCLDR